MITDTIETSVRDALASLGVDPLPATVQLERPARREHGDWSTNVALASAKAAGRNPRELATQLVEALTAAPPAGVQSVEIAGPGFVNFHLEQATLHEIVRTAIEEGTENFARSDMGQGAAVNVEFVSANPNKPLHAGHARGACFGDSLARLLERSGYDVTRETYLNDRGVQMQKFAQSLEARKRGEEPPDDGYLGEYLIEWANEMPDDADPLEWGYARALENHRATLDSVRIHFDVWFSERSLVESGDIDRALVALVESSHVYEEEGATWLRSTDLGDTKDRVLVKSDGDLTYLTPDIAYHLNKFGRQPHLINVWGADHHGYIPRMKAAMTALGQDAEQLEVLVTQMVDLERDGQVVEMSGRAGNFVSFDEIIEEVGPDAARFNYLIQSVDSRQTLDLEFIASQGMDNPVFYVQMAHARLAAIARKAQEAGVETLPIADVDLSVLTHERELEVIRRLSTLTEMVQVACRDREPHKITNWVREFAAAVHGFYQDCYVLGDGISPELTQGRLALVEASRVGLVVGLDLLGVSAPDSM